MVINLGIGALPLSKVARFMGAKISPTTNTSFSPKRLVTNSKQILAGDVFCALRGKEDGHRYIEEAAARGASAIICDFSPRSSLPTLTVNDTRLALGRWARESLALCRPTVIAITGSVGKTTAKNTLTAMLSAMAPTHATANNQNNALGVPFTVLSAPQDTHFLVVECGTDHPGEIEYLSSILAPDIAIITCIGHAHIGTFGSREAIAKEKLAIASHMKNGTLFVPFGEKLTSCFSSPLVNTVAVNLLNEQEKNAASLANADLPALWALSYAKAVALHLRLPFDATSPALLHAAHSRRKAVWEKGILWIDDCYNASPESVYAAILSLLSHGDKRILILGDMLELGQRTVAMHRAMGKLAALHASVCFFFGEYAPYYAEGARTVGGSCNPKAKRHFQVLKGSLNEMANAVLPYLSRESAVLIKASRALHAEDLLQQIKETYIP